MVDPPNILIGSLINSFVAAVFLVSLVLPLLVPTLRRSYWPVWLLLAFSVVMQGAGLALLNLHVHVDMHDGRRLVGCINSPAFGLGPNADSIEMGGPVCRDAVFQRVAMASAVLVVAYVLSVLAARKAYRQGPTQVRRSVGPIVVWTGLLLLFLVGFLGMLCAR